MEPTNPAQKRFDDIKVELHTLDSKISLIAQKIRMIEKNEEVIGRTIVLHNEKLRTIEGAQASSQGSEGAAQQAVNAGSQADIAELKRQVASMREQGATKKEVAELNYTLNSINPLEFITVGQARQIIQDEVEKKLRQIIDSSKKE